MNSTVDQSIINRISKLLALADISRGATLAEAKSAMAKAQQLMTEHSISMLEVAQSSTHSATAGPATFDIGEEVYETGRKTRYDYELNVASILIRCFSVKVLFGRKWDKDAKGHYYSQHIYILVGEPMDIAVAKVVIPILCQAMIGGVRKLIRDMGLPKWTAEIGRPFYDGVMRGYIDGSEQGKARAMASAKRENADAYAIVLVDKDKAMNLYVEKKHQTTTIRDKRRSVGEAWAFKEGFRQGASLDLSGNKLKDGGSQ